MQPAIKSGIEYLLITLLVIGVCFWQLVSGAQDPEPPVARLALMAIGLVIATAMHCVFAMKLVRRTGRPFLPWFIGIVIFMPVGTAVLLAVLLSEPEDVQS
jgi:ABC-type transport system involved in multi-copper enzyme maturation permease subunit